MPQKTTRRPSPETAVVPQLAPDRGAFPIIGLGASAGGLEALEQFFASMPPDRNMAFVIIQHLDPTYKSLMGELLQKYTPLRISDIQDGMVIEPGCIYLNPPDKNVALLHGVFQLVEPIKPHGVNLPIDSFFRALADDHGANAIGIVLSGTGSDGTLGLKALKGAGGMTIAQEERQAAYSGMPRSAIESGMADMVLPVEEMPGAIRRYIEHPYLKHAITQEATLEDFNNTLQKIFAVLRSQTGHDFSNYKETTIFRRIERRMALQRISSISEYAQFLQKTPDETQRLFKDMLIGVTNFFRDPDVFEALGNVILPAFMQQRESKHSIRAWVAGCATGEEAYSLAILFVETIERLNISCPVQIFASDLDGAALECARNAVYPDSIAADVSPERLRRFFSLEDGGYRIKKQIRELVIFAQQNLIKDPPFSKLDMVSCRNLLIYLKPELQKKILPLFHYTLNLDGLLLLGTSESIGEFTDWFAPLDQRRKIFQRQERFVERALTYPVMPFFESSPKSTKESLQVTIEELETSNEELKSANEELQSLNEEMQSSNEELKTSKEELQSANEELTTINTELQHKVNELSRVNNDINNLLASTDIATIFLDIHLRIKRFTPAMKKLFNLISADIGRPISDLTSNLLYDNFSRDVLETLDTLARKTVEIQSSEGRWYSMRLAPYRTTDNIIEGVVVTFVDITESKQRDEALQQAERVQRDARLYAESVLEAIREPLLVLDAALIVQSANHAFYRLFRVTPEQTLNICVYDIGNRQWDIPKLRDLLEQIIRENASFDDYEVEHDFPEIGRKIMRLNARRIDQPGDRPFLILLAIEVMTP